MAELKLLQVFEKEVWFCQRLVNKYQNSARHMKWFRETRMICKSAERLLQLKLPDIAASLLPVKGGDSTLDCQSSRWPTCQMLQFFLVRLLGFAGLCQYIWSMGYKTNELLLQNMELRILFYRHLCKMSVISRMQIICQHLLEKSCEWYVALYPWLQSLPKLESHWLPDGVSLPSRVEDILGSKLDELRNIVSKSKEISVRGKKSTLQKVFGSEPKNLPRFILEEDVTMKSAKKTTSESSHHRVDVSLDDIFGGLVTDETNAQDENHSKTSFEETGEHGSLQDKKETSSSTSRNAALAMETVGDIQSLGRKRQFPPAEDLGVPVPEGIDQNSQQEAKKRKRCFNSYDETADQIRTAQDVKPFVGKQTNRLCPPAEEVLGVKNFVGHPTQKKLKKKRKKCNNLFDSSTDRMHTEVKRLEATKPDTGGKVQATRQEKFRYPTSSLDPVKSKREQPQITGRKKKKRRKNKR